MDGNTADGIRKTFTNEFTDIYVYNLRGNARTAGDLRQREGGGVFDAGARTGVAVLLAAKRAAPADGCHLHYYGVSDYETREEKLTGIATATLHTVPWQALSPNESGDWLNQRNSEFENLSAVGTKERKGSAVTVFATYTTGVKTNRDAWCFNFSATRLRQSVQELVNNYNEDSRLALGDLTRLTRDPERVSWSDNLYADARRGRIHTFRREAIRPSLYRPFFVQHLYFDRSLNERSYLLEASFPTPFHSSIGIWLVGPAAAGSFAAIMTDLVPEHVFGAGNPGPFFPRWTYKKASVGEQDSLMTSSESDVDEWGYRRVDNITDGILALYQAKFGPQVTKDEIFYYTYGVLHSQQYRTTFAADLKRMLPRIPLAGSTPDFNAFVEAGRKLADLHVNYETVEPYPLAEQTPFVTDPWHTYRVEKMRWADKTTKKAVIYNSHITLGDIPAEANRYMLGSRSALEWLIDRYQVKTDKDSGIVNDPNDWCREHGNPRYIVDLIKRVTRVSVDTMKIVDSLPELPL